MSWYGWGISYRSRLETEKAPQSTQHGRQLETQTTAHSLQLSQQVRVLVAHLISILWSLISSGLVWFVTIQSRKSSYLQRSSAGLGFFHAAKSVWIFQAAELVRAARYLSFVGVSLQTYCLHRPRDWETQWIWSVTRTSSSLWVVYFLSWRSFLEAWRMVLNLPNAATW